MLFFGLSSVFVLFYGILYLITLICANQIRHKVENGETENYFPKVSVVIPTYDEEKNIQKKVENIVSLDYPRDKLEVVFVDCSIDGTRDFVKKFMNNSPFNIALVEETERNGLASALNLGYSTAKGDIVIKSDCDKTLEKGAVKEFIKHFLNPDVGAVSGTVRISNPCHTEVGYLSLIENLRMTEAHLDSTYVFSPNCAFRKSLIEPIDERSVADDAELALKIRRKGYKTLYEHNALAFEHSPISLGPRIEQKSRRAQGHIRLLFQNLDLMFNPRYGKFGLVVFPLNFFMMVLSPWLAILTILSGSYWLYNLLGNLSFPLLIAFLLVLFVSYRKSWPKTVAGFIDAQLNLFIGFMKLILKGPDFKWEKTL